tara:strand:- start:183 stop:494 length:312 start_codon:yes stop_codon:yes gene_type:complete
MVTITVPTPGACSCPAFDPLDNGGILPKCGKKCEVGDDCGEGTCEGVGEKEVERSEVVVLEVLEDFKMLNKQVIFTELVGAVQELSKMVSALQAEVADLKESH